MRTFTRHIGVIFDRKSKTTLPGGSGKKHFFLLLMLGSLVSFTGSFISQAKTKNNEERATVNRESQGYHEDDFASFYQDTKEARLFRLEAQPATFCAGNGEDGPRVQVVLGYIPGSEPGAAEINEARNIANGASEVTDLSAQIFGARRVIRFVTDGQCQIAVLKVPFRSSELESVFGVMEALKRKGYTKPDRKYIVLSHQSSVCGVSEPVPADDRLNTKNDNTLTSYGLVGSRCFSSKAYLHELAHTLGAVQDTAPNASGEKHCTDEWDLMCYQSVQNPNVRIVCPDDTSDERLDCGGDDYFNPNPEPGSYLATHWNLAYSPFLDDPTRTEIFQLGSSRVKPKQTVTFSLKGFDPEEGVDIFFNDSSLLTHLDNNGRGVFQGEITIPRTKKNKAIITVRGSHGSYASQPVTVKIKKEKHKRKNH